MVVTVLNLGYSYPACYSSGSACTLWSNLSVLILVLVKELEGCSHLVKSSDGWETLQCHWYVGIHWTSRCKGRKYEHNRNIISCLAPLHTNQWLQVVWHLLMFWDNTDAWRWRLPPVLQPGAAPTQWTPPLSQTQPHTSQTAALINFKQLMYGRAYSPGHTHRTHTAADHQESQYPLKTDLKYVLYDNSIAMVTSIITYL